MPTPQKNAHNPARATRCPYPDDECEEGIPAIHTTPAPRAWTPTTRPQQHPAFGRPSTPIWRGEVQISQSALVPALYSSGCSTPPPQDAAQSPTAAVNPVSNPTGRMRREFKALKIGGNARIFGATLSRTESPNHVRDGADLYVEGIDTKDNAMVFLGDVIGYSMREFHPKTDEEEVFHDAQESPDDLQ